MRLIDADALEKAIYEWMPKDQSTWMDSDLPPIENLVVSIMMTIQEQPTVDIVPVRHGKWISNSPVTMRCNQCTYVASDWIVHEFHYCPNCGARMDEE